MTHTTTENLSFCDALRAIKSGKRAQRAGWNGKGLTAFLKQGSVHGPYLGFKLGEPVAVNHPSTIEGVSVSLFDTDGAEDTAVRLPHICLSYPTGPFVAWAPSQTDMLASDWAIVEEVKVEPAPEPVPVDVRRSRVMHPKEAHVLRALKPYLVAVSNKHNRQFEAELIVDHPSFELVKEGGLLPLCRAYWDDMTNDIRFAMVKGQ
jgi:hypothetical protein